MKNPFTGILFLVLLLAACEKDFDVFIADEPTTPTVTKAIDLFFEQVQPPTVSYQLDAAAGGTLTLPSWGQFVLPPQSLVDAGGQPIIGIVDIELRESLRPGDWLASRLPGYAAGQMLTMAAAVEVHIFLEETPVRLADGKTFTIRLPVTDTIPAPTFFYGQAPAGRLESWTAATDASDVMPTEVLNEAEDTWLPALRLESSRTGWLLIAGITTPVTVTDLCVLLPAGADDDNTAVFAVFGQQPSLVSLMWDEGHADESRFCADNLPAGTSLHLIAVAVDEAGAYKFQQRSLELEGEIQLEWMEPETTELDDIFEFLAGL